MTNPNEKRSNTYWMPRTSPNGTAQKLPKWIVKESSGWIEIKESEELVNFFPLHVRQVIAPDMEKFFVFVHQTHEAFTKGVYEKFVKEIEKELGEVEAKLLKYENGISKDDDVNFYVLKSLVLSKGWEITEDFVNAKILIKKKTNNK